MADEYKPNYSLINKIYISEIIFERSASSPDVTIFAYLKDPKDGDHKIITFSCTFSILNNILIFTKEKSNNITFAIADKLSIRGDVEPTVIDVENIMGEPFDIDNIVFTIYQPMQKNQKDEWVEIPDESLFIIDKVESKESFYSGETSEDNLSNQMAEYFIMLDNSYNYYLKLIDHEISEKKARKKSGLKNELLFRLAIINHLIINNRK